MNGIPLARLLADLRTELQTAGEAGTGKGLRFEIDQIELELQMTSTLEGDESAKVDFKVFNFGESEKSGETAGHRIKLTMRAVGPDGSPYQAASDLADDPE